MSYNYLAIHRSRTPPLLYTDVVNLSCYTLMSYICLAIHLCRKNTWLYTNVLHTPGYTRMSPNCLDTNAAHECRILTSTHTSVVHGQFLAHTYIAHLPGCLTNVAELSGYIPKSHTYVVIYQCHTPVWLYTNVAHLSGHIATSYICLIIQWAPYDWQECSTVTQV